MLTEYRDNLAKNKEIFLKVKVLPGVGKTSFLEKMADGVIKVAVAAAPENGRANQELIKFLAHELGIYRYQIKIITGAGDRVKLIKVSH